MKRLLFTLFLFIPLAGIAQVTVLDSTISVGLNAPTEIIRGQLHHYTDSTGYFIQYDHTDEGLKLCDKEIRRLVAESGLDYATPTRVDVYYTMAEFERINYRLVHASFLSNYSYSYNEWNLSDGYILKEVLNNEVYAILIFKR